MHYEFFCGINIYTISLRLVFPIYILWMFQFFSLIQKQVIDSFSTGKQDYVKYNWWSRLWRIYNYLKRSRRKRKKEEKRKKKQKKDERKREKKFHRRKKWRKLKVVIKSFFKTSRKTSERIAAEKRRLFLKKWAKRRRRRLFHVYVKGIGKRRKISENKKRQLERIQKEIAFEKYRKRRIYRFIFKRNIQIFTDVLKGKGLPKRKSKRGPSPWRQMWYPKQLAITVNSLMFFLLSYFFIAFFDKLSMAITSLLFDYKTVIYYYGIEFLVDYDDWFADSVKAIFATGPIMGLLIALLSMVIYSIIYLENGILKTLLLWAIFHGFNRIVNGTLIGSMIGQGFGYVIMYLYYSDTGKLIMSLMMVSISVIIGTASTKYWIMSSNSYYNFSKPDNRQVFILNQVFLPFVFGNIIIYLLNMPEPVFYDTLVNIAMLFMIIPPMILNKYQQDLYFDETPKSINISIKTLLFTVVFVAVYRILLNYGVHIG